MPPRSSWKGFIKLSLVSVPVKAYTASASGAEIRLNQLNKNTMNRIRYQKTDPDHGEVASEDIVSGYEFAKGQYVVIDPAELEKLRTKSDKSINIGGFIDPAKVDPIFLAGRTYYLLPDGAPGQKPYALLIEGMREKNCYAIAQVVISGKEQLVLLRPQERMLVMHVLNYAHRVKAASAFDDELVDQTLSDEELTLAKTLIDASTLAEFKLDDYKDEYTEKLTKLIQMKVDGQEIVQVTDPEEPKIVNLMEALKQSVAQATAGDGASASKKKMAPSKKGSTKKAKKSG